MKNKGMYCVVAISMMVQSVINCQLLVRRYDDFPGAFSFLLGVPQETEYIILMFWYLIFVSISFYFSGEISESLSGYGKYFIIRNYSKMKWIIFKYGSIGIRILGFILLHTLISLLISIYFKIGVEALVDVILILKLIFIYYLTFSAILLIQMFIELFTTPQLALLSVNMYVVFSILLAGILFKYKEVELLLYALIPNFAMGLRLDIISGDSFIIHYPVAIMSLIIFTVIILMLSIKKIKVKDIL